MTILVTGGTGFIGHRLVERLCSQKKEVRCIARSPERARDLAELGAEVVPGDVHPERGLLEACQGVESVIHLAGLVRAWKKTDYFETNAEGTRRLTAAARAAGVKKFLLVSSLAASGPGELGIPVTEDHPSRPITTYGESKLAAERVLGEAAGDMEWSVVRPCVVYGPWERDFLILFRMASRFKRVFFIGPRGARLSLIHVDDLVDLMLLALERAPSGGVYQASDGRAYLWEEVIEEIGRALGKEARPVRIAPALLRPLASLAVLLRPFTSRPSLLSPDKLREGFERYWVSSPARARRELGWEPKVSLQDGIRSTGEWYRERRWL